MRKYKKYSEYFLFVREEVEILYNLFYGIYIYITTEIKSQKAALSIYIIIDK